MTAVVGPRSVWKNLVGYYISNDTRSYSGSGSTWNDLSAKNNDLVAADVSGLTYSNGAINLAGTSTFNSSGALLDIIESGKLTVVAVANATDNKTGDLFSLSDAPYTQMRGEIDAPAVDSFLTKEISQNDYVSTVSVVEETTNMTATSDVTKNVTANNYTLTVSVVEETTNMTATTGVTKNVTANNYSLGISVTEETTNMTATTGVTKNVTANNYTCSYSYDHGRYYKNGISITLNSTINRDLPNFVNFDLDISRAKSSVDMPANTTSTQFYCLTLDRTSSGNLWYIDSYVNNLNGRIDYSRNFYSQEPDSILFFPGTSLKFGNGVSGGPTTAFRMIAIFDRALNRDEVQDLFHSIRGKYSL